MSKPKIGDKYIIEIDRCYSGELYGVKGFRSPVFDQNGLDKLTPYDADEAYAAGYTLAESRYREARDQVEQEAYQRGYDAGSHEATSLEYQQGLDDAWDAARYIEKIREFEEQKKQETEIRNGDEVTLTIFGREIKGIAVDREIDGTWKLINERGGLMQIGTADLTKTGRHVNLSELFGGEDE